MDDSANAAATPNPESDFAQRVLEAVETPPDTLPPLEIDEEKTRNAAGCMTAFLCARLAYSGESPTQIERSTFRWNDGIINVRNAVNDHLWTNLRETVVEHFRQIAAGQPAVYLMVAWQPDGDEVHVWAVPEPVVYEAFPNHPVGRMKEKRTVRIIPGVNQFERCTDSPNLEPFYRSFDWSAIEHAKLVEAVKLDEAARHRNRGDEDVAVEDNQQDDVVEVDTTPGYTTQTVEFLSELPAHVTDGEWHESNKQRYRNVLRDPTQKLIEMLRHEYIERLSPEVAGGKRHASILKKNDYGKGGYHDHYWFAFYDPAAGSKTKSVQLFFRMVGSDQLWRYGFSMGNYCEDYLDRLQTAFRGSKKAVAAYIQSAPEGTIIRLCYGDEEKRMSPEQFAQRLTGEEGPPTYGLPQPVNHIDIVREMPLETLPDHDETLVDEVGEYFTWAWPLFDASVTGTWPQSAPIQPKEAETVQADEDVDEDAPATLEELSDLTSLPRDFVEELEQALLAKQQAVLVGPPGTSKTYIAKQFARYFVRQRKGRPQGSLHVLYMHANWTYEDFFEGIKPKTEGTQFAFESKRGFFLEWAEQLKSYDTSARHVLVLDEINRCDTAAVLGELLQLLEYRGTTVRLLSGRRFVFPRNLFIIGTMNSADRSIGRMDLALRRRFLWLDLHPQIGTLQTWLQRPGNNPIGFHASALARCNELLAGRGIPPEQHIGHALFMVQESTRDDESSLPQDIPLTEKHLRRIVRFSVLPYVRELFTTQFGQVDAEAVQQISGFLLSCVEGDESGEGQDG